MIKLLDYNDRALIEHNKSRGASALRIKALFKTYGIGRSFISFFADETGDVLICVQDNFAVVYIKDESHVDEVSQFLAFTVNSILSEFPLKLSGYKVEIGNTYALYKWEPVLLEGVSNELQTGYNLLSKVFTGSINSTTYKRWYTDLSHRIRHDMSKIYTYQGACSATTYLMDDGTIIVAQLATIEQERGKGLAQKMLYHIASQTPNTREIMLLSQDKTSDKFYEKIGCTLLDKWYCYVR
ncbi:MAG: GNAT family N-acetyltransferase [Oscillospiraceae bacterium]